MSGSLFDVAGKRVVVTGGSRGIGLMIASGFAAAGATVTIVSRRQAALDAAVAQLAGIAPVRAIAADLATSDGVAVVAARVAEDDEGLDVLVHSAGATWGAPLEDYPEAGWDKVHATNVKAPFYLTTALLGPLRARASDDDPARVIVIGSIDGLGPPESEAYAYSSSKAATHMLARHLARRLAADRITVNAIAPGPFPTPMLQFALDDPATRAEIERRIPLGRLGRPDDIAGTAIYLASRAGAYVNGAVLPVDGGHFGTLGGVFPAG